MIQGGANFFSILEKNAPVPCASLINDFILKSTERMHSGILDFDGLKAHADAAGTAIVVISEDASRVKSSVTYDPASNSLFGLIAPVDPATGLPLTDSFKVNLPSDMVNYLKSSKQARFVQLIMAEPLADGASPFVLGYFPTNTEYTAQESSWRWQFIQDQMLLRGIKIIISTDGAPMMLSAQKSLNGFGEIYDFLGYKFVADPSSFDSSTTDLVLGDYIATSSHLQILIDNPLLSKFDHELTQTMVGSDSTKDKMNTDGSEKICRTKVVRLLDELVPGSAGTQTVLKLMDLLLESFTRYNVPDRFRLFNGMFVLEFFGCGTPISR